MVFLNSHRLDSEIDHWAKIPQRAASTHEHVELGFRAFYACLERTTRVNISVPAPPVAGHARPVSESFCRLPKPCVSVCVCAPVYLFFHSAFHKDTLIPERGRTVFHLLAHGAMP